MFMCMLIVNFLL